MIMKSNGLDIAGLLTVFSHVAIFVVGQEHMESVENQTVCYGTSHGLGVRGDQNFRYNEYKGLYTNCTYLAGNLEIVFLDYPGKVYDLSFLSSVEQVTGYVLVIGVHADFLHLTNLKIIRGKTLFHYPRSKEYYSLFVALNYDKNDLSIGLKELRFTALQEILAGKIFFMNNNLLCYENSVNWHDINPHVTPSVEFKFNSTDYRRPCGKKDMCDKSCYSNITGSRHCWGSGPGMCQKLTQGKACHQSCERRCFGKLPNECCHQECAGGCSAQLKTDCLACRNFFNEGQCVPFCPSATKYDNRLLIMIPNPDAKFAYGSICVKKCPGYLLEDSGSCVRSCSEGKHPKNGSCVPCEDTCPKTCKGTEGSVFLNADNLGSFSDCTTIDGNIRILKNSFTDDPHFNIKALHPSNLSVFQHLREITGYLLIQSDHPEFTNLSFLSNLEVINGRDLDGGQVFHIMATPLRSLELTSLKRITNGNVYITGNRHLCYASKIDWDTLFLSPHQKAVIMLNKDENDCVRDGEVCDAQCSGSGCWGKGANKCISCLKYEYEREHQCLDSCQDLPYLYNTSSGKCRPCHEECENTCTGPNSTQCARCAHVAVHGPGHVTQCLAQCPMSMYADENDVCQPCHPYCNVMGCTGPDKRISSGGCNACEMAVKVGGVITCLPPSTSQCLLGYHLMVMSSSVYGGGKLCEQCHELCKTCNGPGINYCTECNHFLGVDNVCTKGCPTYAYADRNLKRCVSCHIECRGGCNGSDSIDCLLCSNVKVLMDGDEKHCIGNISDFQFNCSLKCPQHLNYLVHDASHDQGRIVCADESHPEVQEMLSAENADRKKRVSIVVPCVIAILLLGLAIALYGYYRQDRAKSCAKTAELTARMTGFNEPEPVSPSNAQPDLAKLRFIKESDLRKGGMIGSGAFGTVYKGFWIPTGECVKIPVAIKVLQDGTSANLNKELLDEARVMASVEHLYCIRILAVCMSAQMMLITQLMPLGCLLDYVRKNYEHIGSRVLLNWCTQIAKGMAYLEARGIVHRDLAARNVLVQTPIQIKITDFGLAKLLDYKEEEYRSSGGKMPIKWLALECIQHRIFTHMSDVWSFGVTIWELFTFGQKPYQNIHVRDFASLLEKGERLPQPAICTIDVYMIMIKCWMLDAESRPTMKELAEECAKMARDPGRYLVVEGDTLLRLPSYTYDTADLVRSVSVIEDIPHEVVEADNYFHTNYHPPISFAVTNDDNNSPTAQLLPQAAGTDRDGQASCKQKTYTHLNAAVKAFMRRQKGTPSRVRDDSFNSRYSSDPMKILNVNDEVEGVSLLPGMEGVALHPDQVHTASCQQFEMPPTIDQSNGLRCCHLPVDKDNYLAPCSSSKQLPIYSDLDYKGYYQNEKLRDGNEASETDCMLALSEAAPAMHSPLSADHTDTEADRNEPSADAVVWHSKHIASARHNDIAQRLINSSVAHLNDASCILENHHKYLNLDSSDSVLPTSTVRKECCKDEGMVPPANPEGMVPPANPEGMVPPANPEGMVPPANPEGMDPPANPEYMSLESVV